MGARRIAVEKIWANDPWYRTYYGITYRRPGQELVSKVGPYTKNIVGAKISLLLTPAEKTLEDWWAFNEERGRNED